MFSGMSFYQTIESIVPPAPLTGCLNGPAYGGGAASAVIGTAVLVGNGTYAGEWCQITIGTIGTYIIYNTASNAAYITVRTVAGVIISSGFGSTMASPLTTTFTSTGIYRAHINLNGFPTCQSEFRDRSIWIKRIS